ncbi:response regulator [Paracoccus sp. PS-1]|uniref:response regulator n=1 Tax=unclassified Paracoccus (in: a-proteobacteria) TaxID=2688777 RepID=UPI000491D90E|nr:MULTISPECIES: response regulator [unclassified Paracoccus (in: a-proteobacteria)]MDQ7263308.1 response regulator [Paracoccus sp. PS1]UFM66477.1 response regulator [Paracoccus sp. MA]
MEQERIGAEEFPTWRATLPDRPLTGLTVLVVEDSRVASEAVRLLCLRSGARIRRADSIRSALRHLQTYRPGAVIVDMGLPDGDGADMIATIARALPRVPVILGISGDPANRDAVMRAGADGFLTKPIESLAAFQEAILAALPPEARPPGLRVLPDDMIAADPEALRDDLAHVADVLSQADDTAAIDYIARFLAGVARSAHDRTLEDAATALARDHARGQALATDLARISGLVQDRLAAARIS